MAATLLDRPVRTSRYLFPQPAPASMLHDLEETYFFLNGFVNQPLTLKINSTVSTVSIEIVLNFFDPAGKPDIHVLLDIRVQEFCEYIRF